MSMKYLLILLVLGFASCTGAEPRMTAPSNKEKFAIEDFAKSVTAAEFTYRGHSYIWFHHPGGWDGIIQIASVVRNKSI